jgi:hypothetical protein
MRLMTKRELLSVVNFLQITYNFLSQKKYTRLIEKFTVSEHCFRNNLPKLWGDHCGLSFVRIGVGGVATRVSFFLKHNIGFE